MHIIDNLSLCSLHWWQYDHSRVHGK